MGEPLGTSDDTVDPWGVSTGYPEEGELYRGVTWEERNTCYIPINYFPRVVLVRPSDCTCLGPSIGPA